MGTGVYVWSPDETTALRTTEGAKLEVAGSSYLVPKASECNDCHTGRKDKLLGFEAISLGQPAATGLTLAVLAVERRLSAPPAKSHGRRSRTHRRRGLDRSGAHRRNPSRARRPAR